MQLETYAFIKRPVNYYYEFFSDGPNGSIKKVVEFYKLEAHEKEIYNLEYLNQLMMENTTKKKKTDKAKKATDKFLNEYINDPYFVKKRELGEAFLKKAGLPEAFTKSQSK